MQAAQQAGRLVDPTCNVCHVAYVESYEGPCQEPLPPYTDPARTCRGTVSIWPDRIAAAAVCSAYPAILADLKEKLLSEESVEAAVQIRVDLLKAAGHQPSDEFRRNYSLTVREHVEAAFNKATEGHQ